VSGRLSAHGILHFTGLTPELSRPVAGWRTRASVAQARCGVGLNELLGPATRAEAEPEDWMYLRRGSAQKPPLAFVA
jgi:hypothetical protein